MSPGGSLSAWDGSYTIHEGCSLSMLRVVVPGETLLVPAGPSMNNFFLPPTTAAVPNVSSIHLISSAEKFTIVGMKFSLIMMERICFQSVVLSPSSRQMDSRASFTAAGGLAIERTSTRCCFFIDLTATGGIKADHNGQKEGRREVERNKGRKCD